MAVTDLGDLHTPVEEVLRSDVVLVLPDVIQQAAVRHELSDQLHRGGQADSQQAAHIWTDHTCHHIRFLHTRWYYYSANIPPCLQFSDSMIVHCVLVLVAMTTTVNNMESHTKENLSIKSDSKWTPSRT